jgi:hypothetical protein
MNTRDREDDDLTVINGIKEKRQKLLRKSLNVRRYQDLANLPVDEIVSTLKAENNIISENEVKRWIAQAGKLAAATNPVSRRDKQLIKVEADERVSNHGEEGEWVWLKAFVVEFCILRLEEQVMKREIRVLPVKVSQKGDWLDNGETKKTPIIINKGEALYPWMRTQLGEQEWQEPELENVTEALPFEEPAVGEVPVEAPPVESARTPVKVKVTQIRAFQPFVIDKPTGIGEAGHPFVGIVTSDEPFALEVDFFIPKISSTEIARRKTTYSANFYIQNMSTAKKTPLGNTKSAILVPEKVGYTARLPKVTMESGKYRLGVLVNVLSSPPSIGYLEVPMLRVV